MGDSVLFGEGFGVPLCGRCNGSNLCIATPLQRFAVDRANETGANEANVDFSVHSEFGFRPSFGLRISGFGFPLVSSRVSWSQYLDFFLQAPSLPILVVEKLIGVRVIGDLEVFTIPQKLVSPVADAHAAEQHSFGQRAGEIKIRSCR